MDAASGGVDQVLRELAGPTRLTGGPASAQQQLTAVSDDVTSIPVASDVEVRRFDAEAPTVSPG